MVHIDYVPRAASKTGVQWVGDTTPPVSLFRATPHGRAGERRCLGSRWHNLWPINMDQVSRASGVFRRGALFVDLL